jgi:LacI family transcriptional regulator
VARVAGVAQSTVSRALRDDARVSAATRKRVRRLATDLGYVPSRRGRSLSTRATGQVAVVVADLGNPFYAEAIEHLHAAFDERERRVVVLTDPLETTPLEPERLLDGSVDGAVLTTTLLTSDLPRELAARGLPVVQLNRAVDGDVADACVTENVAGGRAAAEELVRLGHTAVGAIFGPADTSTGRDREVGFRSGMAAAGIELAPVHVRRGPFAYATGHRALGQMLAAPRRPTAVFCANDVVAIGALNAARALGVAVPGELTVFGFDDIAMASWDVFALSTVRQDLAAMARTAASMLCDRIADPAGLPRRVTLPAAVVLRGSHAGPLVG